MSQVDIKQKLRDHDVLPTAQRLEVAEVLLRRPQHLSVDQIIDVLRSSGSRISKATVYNSLNLFSKKGLVREINVDAGRKFYDSTTQPHHHFFHVDTGALTDISPADVKILGIPSLPKGTVQEGIDVVVRVKNKRV